MSKRFAIILVVLLTSISKLMGIETVPNNINIIEAALRQNADSLNPITMEWVYERTRSGTTEEKREEQFSWQDGKIRARTVVFNVRATATKAVFDASFDGQRFFSTGMNGGAFGERALSPSDDLIFRPTYFLQSGLQPPLTGRQLLEGRAISSVLQALSQGINVLSASDIQENGRTVIALKITVANRWRADAVQTDLGQLEAALRTWITNEQELKGRLDAIKQSREMPAELIVTYYLDRDLHHAMVGWEEGLADGTILRRCTNSDFLEVADRKLFLPKRSKIDWHISQLSGLKISKNPIWSEAITVKSITTNRRPDQEFVLSNSQPGTILYNNSDSARPTVSRVPAPKQAVDDVEMDIRRLVQARAASPATNVATNSPEVAPIMRSPARPSYWLYIPVAVCACVIAFMGIVIVRKNRRLR